jgi:peptide/nickel transport system substrate-binding protein
MRAEPNDMLTGFVDRSAIHKPVFTAALASWNVQEQPFPILAAAIPQLNTDQWQVSPDGRMETTYTLRPNLTWHDGQPLTADDFVFTLRTERYRLETGAAPSAELKQMDEIVAPDARTVVIRWKQPYAEAAAPELIALPRHVFEPLSDRLDAEAFFNHPAWHTEWVGAGPFKVERWERGSFVEGSAFVGFALGQPKMGRVRLSWNNDPNVSLTRLLAGDADLALDGAIRFEQASVLRDQWRDAGTILLNPTSLRYIQFQARPEYVSPKALLDVRARKAVFHAIDRPALAEAMLEDRNLVADTIPPRGMAYSDSVDRAIAKYPYDPRRTEQLLSELGFAKGGDGIYASPAEGRFRMEVRGVSGGQEEQDTTIVAGYMRDAAIDSTITLLPSSSRQVDEKMKSTFPGITLNNNTLQRGLGLDKWTTTRLGGPENDWTGTNRMGWTHPDFDRLYDAWRTTLSREEAGQRMTEMMKLLSEELPSLPLYYNYQVLAHTAALAGPQAITPDSTRYSNVHEWAWAR